MKLKSIFFATVTAFLLPNVFAQGKEAKNTFIPLLLYEQTTTSDDKFFTPGGGLIFSHEDDANQEAINKDGLFSQIIYINNYVPENALFKDERDFHIFSSLFAVTRGKNIFTGFFSFAQETPLSTLKGLGTGLLYGHELLDGKNYSLVFGGGVVVSCIEIFGLWTPALPIPYCSFKMKKPLIDLSLDVSNNPMLNMTLFPEKTVNFTVFMQLCGFSRFSDLSFDIAVHVYPFHSAKPPVKMFNVFAGFGNSKHTFATRENDYYSNQMYRVYGGVDLAALKVSAGYNIRGWQEIKDKREVDIGSGVFLSAQFAIPF